MIVSYWLTWQFTVFISIYLYDVKMVIAFNYKESSKTVTLKEVNGSIIECSGAPKHSNPNLLPIGETFGFVVFLKANI